MKKLTALAVLLGVAACSDIATAPPPALAPTRLAPTSVSRGLTAEPIANRYIVRFRDDEPSAALRAKLIERTHGAIVERVYSSVIKGAALTIADDAAEALRSDVGILAVEQDQTLHLATTQSNPAWGLDRIDQRNRPYSASYSYALTGSGVTVYILDTGINFTHNEYAGRAFTGVDEITPGGNAADCNGHGSHVSGTIGGNTFGVAKGVTLVAVRVLDCSGSGSTAGVIAGIDWVTQNAVKPAAANMSLGGSFSALLNQAVQNSIASGVTYAVAAGNSTLNACNESPSSTPNAITVAASDSIDRFAFFSNFGSCVDIIAPGVNVKSAWFGSNSATNIISGTSMASPHVAGAAALYLEANPNATPAQVAAALTANATANVISSVPAGTPNKLLFTGFLIPTAPNQPPVARYTSNCVGQSLPNQCAFDASTSSDDAGIVSYKWDWGNGKPVETKLVPIAKNTWAAPGVYTVTLTVTDGGGLTSTTFQQVAVGTPPTNQSPSAAISAPANNASFAQGTSVSFAGTGTDPEDGTLAGGSLVWTSNVSGQIGTGTSFSTSTLPVGTHTITLKATDSQGAFGTAGVTITIVAPNQAPTAAISSPANNSSFAQGASVNFAGTGSDPEQGALTGASLVWTSNLSGQIGTGASFSTTTLPAGTHTITLKATDAQGAFGSASVTVTIVAPNQPPIAAISAPSNNSSFVQGSSVSFAGTGTDPEQGALTGASLVWTSNLGGQIGTGTSFSTTSLGVGTHTVTLKATDAQVAFGTSTVTVTITQAPPVNQPPVASFTVTCTGQSLPHQCALDGSGSTDDVGITTWKWDWGNGRSEVKTGPLARNTWSAAGSYQVMLTVTDTNGLTASITKTVVIP